MNEDRLKNEILHGRYLLEAGAGEVWGWETPAGKKRWARRVTMLVSHIKPGMKVLEIGCGTGYFTRELAKTGAAITAIDISPELLADAKKSAAVKDVVFRVENAYSLTFSDGSFDTVVGSSVLHHLDLDAALREFYRVLKPGGSAYFTEPNMMNPQIALQKNIPWIKRRMGDSPDETAFFRWGLGRKLREHGFSGIEITPFDFLHPGIPETFLPVALPFCAFLEKIPVLSEIAGSLYIRAVK